MSFDRDYVNQIAPIIQKYAKQYGYKVASPVIAQACVESIKRTSLSLLASKYHNYFGLKCGSSWKGKSVNLSTKEEYTVGTLTTIKDNFRVYDSMEEGVKGYFDFISTKRYANLKNMTTPRAYLEEIKRAGYATSSTYVNNCMGRIDKYNLTVYDNFNNASQSNATDSNPVPISQNYTVGKVYTLQTDLNVRNDANGTQKLYTELTANAKKNGFATEKGFAALRKGTRVTCKGVKYVGSSVWLKIPSGYVCGISKDGKVYIK